MLNPLLGAPSREFVELSLHGWIELVLLIFKLDWLGYTFDRIEELQETKIVYH